MSYLHAALLGLIQGVAEFLPISSSGHLAILHNLLPSADGAMNNAAFDVLLHFGTLIAVCVVFRRTIVAMIAEFGKMIQMIFSGTFRMRKASKYQLMDLYVIVTTLLLVPFALFEDRLNGVGDNLWSVGAMLLFTAFLLFVADHSVMGDKQLKDMTMSQVIKMGLFQGLGTLPGISRSGATISAGVNMGFDRSTMVEFSFMMSIPAVLGAMIFKSGDMVKAFVSADIGPYILGTVIAAAVGVASIQLVKYVARKNKFGWFMWYCIAVGVGAIVLDIVR